MRLVSPVYNKNLKIFVLKDEKNQNDFSNDFMQFKYPYGLSDKKNKHQLLLTTLYNKIVLLHLSP